MKKVLLFLVLFVMFSSVSLAHFRYPSEQIIERCFPVGQSLWDAKRNIAQLSLDYDWDMIWYSYVDEQGKEGIRLFKWLDDRCLKIVIYIKNDKVYGHYYLIQEIIGLLD